MTITLYKWTNYSAIPGYNKGFDLSNVVSSEFFGDIEEEDYILPPGFKCSESNAGTMELYDPTGRCCTIEITKDDLPKLCVNGKNFFLQKVLPDLVGVSESCIILGWKKQQVSAYMTRAEKYRNEFREGIRDSLPPDIYPEPIQRLASGPIWTRQQIEDYRDARK